MDVTCSDQREEEAFGPNIVDDGCFELSNSPFPAEKRVRGDHVCERTSREDNQYRGWERNEVKVWERMRSFLLS